MKCPKCNRNTSNNRMRCLYCGEYLNQDLKPEQKLGFSGGNREKIRPIDASELPAKVRAKIEDAFESGQKEVLIPNELWGSEYPMDVKVGNHIELSREELLLLLQRFQGLHKEKRIKTAKYHQTVMELLKNYINTFDTRSKINFVVNEIAESDFMAYLTDSMLKELRAWAVKTASNTLY